METKTLQIFENTEFGTVRTANVNGEPYFAGKDVAEILAYKNLRDAVLRHVDADDKVVVKHDTLGGLQALTVINESGLYSLILSSKLPNAKRFKHWITSEVLPAIRKHGVYAMDELLENPDTLIAALQSLKEDRKKTKALTETVETQTKQIAEIQPKASYYDVVLNCKDLISITAIAKDYGWSANKMNSYLHGKGIQYRQGNMWVLYQKYAQSGYTNTKTYSHLGNDGDVHTSVHMYWTQAGRLFLYNTLKADGILPTIEKETI